MPVFYNDWQAILAAELERPYYQELRRFLLREYRTVTVYPDMYDIFNAFHYTPFQSVKVVIVGQDPYHGPGQAHGMAFSVYPGVVIPPSLRNIFTELERDLGITPPEHGYLVPWALEGVFLLNAVLTVRRGEPGSHRNVGWEHFTDRVIELLGEREDPIVFLLWGQDAQAKRALIHNPRHLVLQASHPSPLSAHRGFFGSRPFSRANAFLRAVGKEGVDWRIPQTIDELEVYLMKRESPLRARGLIPSRSVH